MDYVPRYTGYRFGILNACFNSISKLGGMENTTREHFVKDCMSDPEINDILGNGYFDRLDDMGGIPKLALTLYSKYIQHNIIAQ